MSIGVLGFVVWSQWLAFHICEDMVINSTVGWNGLLFLFIFLCYSITNTSNTKFGNLLDTFYSLNANKSALSAGNLQQGSSETIRGDTYDLFKKNFSCFFKQDFTVPVGQNQEIWLSWFIGFLEGDGAILEHKGRCYFVVTQKDDTVLHEVHKTLKIGKVKHFYDYNGNRKYSRFIVAENKGIFLLYLLLNGNLVLESRVKQLSKWAIALNNASKFNYFLFYSNKLPELIYNTKQPTLNDAWLSGFTDAEGCFSVKIGSVKTTFYVQLLFILDQKDGQVILNKIALLFNSIAKAKLKTVNKYIKTKKLSNYINNMFRLTISCNDKKKSTSYYICNYFNKYPLKTTKKISFQIWNEISDIVLGKQPLSNLDLYQVRKLRRTMNFFTIENQPLGYANKS